MIKRVLFLFLLNGLAICSFGQETLFGNINNIGGFGGPMIEVSTINGETVVDVGGGGALILDNFFFGGYGMGTDAPNIKLGLETYDIDFDHGGLWFGYAVSPQKLVHLYSSFRLGWGDVTIKDGDGDKIESDNILVLTPEIGVELNVTSWFKLGFTGGYRFVDGTSALNALPYSLDDDSFSSPFGMLTFRFGGFGDWDDNSNGRDGDFDSNFDF